jgi:hypothetical protein
MGASVSHGFKQVSGCQGAFDAIKVRYTGQPSGVEADGWAWLAATSTAPSQVLFANSAGTIVGAGETVTDRADVQAALPQVKSKHVGWKGEIEATNGKVTVYALAPGPSLCAIGTKDISKATT